MYVQAITVLCIHTVLSICLSCKKASEHSLQLCWQIACNVSSLSAVKGSFDHVFFCPGVERKILSTVSDEHLLFANDSKSRSIFRS